MKRLCSILLLLSLYSSAFAQDINLELLYNKKWTITETYVEGWKMEMPVQDDYFMIFSNDQQMEVHEKGNIVQNTWVYLPDRKTLILSNEELDEKAEMVIHSLTQSELRCDVTSSEGMKITWVMRPLE